MVVPLLVSLHALQQQLHSLLLQLLLLLLPRLAAPSLPRLPLLQTLVLHQPLPQDFRFLEAQAHPATPQYYDDEIPAVDREVGGEAGPCGHGIPSFDAQVLLGLQVKQLVSIFPLNRDSFGSGPAPCRRWPLRGRFPLLPLTIVLPPVHSLLRPLELLIEADDSSVLPTADDGPERLVAHSVLAEEGDVVGRGAIVGVHEPVGVGVAGLGHAELLGLAVHLEDKPPVALQLREPFPLPLPLQQLPPSPHRQRHARVVPARQHQAVQQLIDRVDLPVGEGGSGAADPRLEPSDHYLLRSPVDPELLADFEGEDAGHDLGEGGNFLAVLAVHRGHHPRLLPPSPRLVDDVGLGSQLRRRVEVLRVVPVYLLPHAQFHLITALHLLPAPLFLQGSVFLEGVRVVTLPLPPLPLPRFRSLPSLSDALVRSGRLSQGVALKRRLPGELGGLGGSSLGQEFVVGFRGRGSGLELFDVEVVRGRLRLAGVL